MRRLLATLRLDFRLQLRSQLYTIGIGIAVFFGLLLRLSVDPQPMRTVLPALFLLTLGSTTYLFAGGMVLFEKAEGTLDAQKVTPLRVDDYFASKLLTLGGFALVESMILVILTHGFAGLRMVPMFAGLLVMGGLYTLIGLGQIARHDSITEFLMPSAFVVGAVLPLPVLDHLDLWPGLGWYAWPSQAPLLLMRAAFEPIAGWQWVYALAYSALSLGALYLWARRSFRQHLLMT